MTVCSSYTDQHNLTLSFLQRSLPTTLPPHLCRVRLREDYLLALASKQVKGVETTDERRRGDPRNGPYMVRIYNVLKTQRVRILSHFIRRLSQNGSTFSMLPQWPKASSLYPLLNFPIGSEQYFHFLYSMLYSQSASRKYTDRVIILCYHRQPVVAKQRFLN